LPFIQEDGHKLTRSHDGNIENFFKLFGGFKIIESFEKIDKIESNWMRKCYNAGLIYSVRGEYNSYGYDFSNFYASILADEKFMIPMNKGKECKIHKIPEKIKTGYYNVKITSNNDQVKKIFSFSKEHVYTHISLKHAIKLKEKYDINIELITDVTHNCYVFKLEDLISGKKIFNKWYQAILNLKKKFTSNILLKMLSSSLWGHLTRRNIIHRSADEAEKLNIGMSNDCDYYNLGLFEYLDDGEEFYKLHDLNNPYKYPLRLKCFLTAMGRVKTANVAEQDIESVIRIHTDGICFNKEQNLQIENFISESKTTGLLQFPIHRKQQTEEDDEDDNE
jgi:hypothetical protein